LPVIPKGRKEFLPFLLPVYLYTHVLLYRLIYFYRSSLFFIFAKPYGGGGSVEKFDLYQDIAMRTQGDIYIGVVGPVRTGKSTFIRRFMETLVLPAMEQGFSKERVVDHDFTAEFRAQ
jgi:hypothetical protein